mgnify:CR=1 FL=1
MDSGDGRIDQRGVDDALVARAAGIVVRCGRVRGEHGVTVPAVIQHVLQRRLQRRTGPGRRRADNGCLGQYRL